LLDAAREQPNRVTGAVETEPDKEGPTVERRAKAFPSRYENTPQRSACVVEIIRFAKTKEGRRACKNSVPAAGSVTRQSVLGEWILDQH